MKRALTGIIIFMAFIFTSCDSPQEKEDAPDFTVDLIEGDSITLSSLRGNYVLLDFWASWCAPCLRELPDIKSINDEFSPKENAKGQGFVLLSVALERKRERVLPAIKRFDLDWDLHGVDESRFVRFSNIAQAYGVTEIPSKFLIGPDGTILAKNPSINQIRQMLQENMN